MIEISSWVVMHLLGFNSCTALEFGFKGPLIIVHALQCVDACCFKASPLIMDGGNRSPQCMKKLQLKHFHYNAWYAQYIVLYAYVGHAKHVLPPISTPHNCEANLPELHTMKHWCPVSVFYKMAAFSVSGGQVHFKLWSKPRLECCTYLLEN